MARRKLIAGNWKMNGSRASAVELARGIVEHVRKTPPSCDVLVCPPAILIEAVAEVTRGSPVAVGGQDCHTAPSGAHTGDIAAPMLKDAGCGAVIVGHSERRTNHGETDALVRAKAMAAHAAGLLAIIAIGETLAQRDAGATAAVVTGQLRGSLPEGATAANTVIAYEPVWAIGTGRTPSTADVAETHAVIRREAAAILGREQAEALRILYGGSVTAANARELLALPDVDGALVGGASLKVEQFAAIIAAAGGA